MLDFKNSGYSQSKRKTDLWHNRLSAEEASPGELLTILRSYWQIENGLHYRIDVTFHEDETRFSQNSAAHVMSMINNIVLDLIATDGYQFAPSARHFFAANPEAAINLLI
jgi:predicted transposase YbfD/YdcC